MTKSFKVGDRVTVCEEDVRKWPGLAGVKTIQRISESGIVWFEETGLVGRDDGIQHVPAPALIDPAKKYRTRDGREVRIYATDGGESTEVHGAIKDGDGWGTPQYWHANGQYFRASESGADLIEVKPERSGWVNVYPSSAVEGGIHIGRGFATKEEADRLALNDRIACLHLTFREGDGLEGK